MIELINVSELRILFRPNLVADFIRNIARNIFELLDIEQNIFGELIQIINPIIRVNVPELNRVGLNIEAQLIQENLFNPPAINPVLLEHFLNTKPKPIMEKAMDDIVNRIPTPPFCMAHIRLHKDSTFYATETPGIFSRNSSF